MEFSPVLNFFIGLISSIGYYRLFFTINRPAVRWRFIVMLVVVFLSRPVSMVWSYNMIENAQGINIFLTLVNFLIDSVSLIACALLGPHRRRAFVASVIILYLAQSTEIFVSFFIAGFLYPLFKLNNALQITFAAPQVYYTGLFLFNLIVMCYCFIAARWLRKTRENPPVKLCVFLYLFFLSFVIIIPIWQYYVITQMLPSSFFSSALLGIMLMIIPLFALYFFSRLASNTKQIPVNGKAGENTAYSANAGRYAVFIGQLSKRELEVISAVLAGSIRYKTLAYSLNISVNTVKTHLQHIYQITGVKNIEALSALFSGYSPASPSNHP